MFAERQPAGAAGAGPAARSANLVWGQRYHWLRYRQAPAGTRHEAHITDTFPVPAGTTLQQIRAALAVLVRRHEILRTVMETDESGAVRQVVQEPAPMPLLLVSTEPGGGPRPAEAVQQLTVAEFDLAREWPWRLCVVTTAGQPRRVHCVFNHIAFDDVSLGILREEFAAVLDALAQGHPAALAPVLDQPVDLARSESRRPAAALAGAREHWRAELARLPSDALAGRRSPDPAPGASFSDQPLALSVALTAPELLAISRRIAERHRVWPSAVHLAAYALTMGAYTGAEVIAHRMYTSQREASGHPRMLTCLSSPTLIGIDLSDDPTFGQVVARAAVRVAESLHHAHLPYDDLAGLIDAESQRRGETLRVAGDFNFLSNAPRSCGIRRTRFTRNPEPLEWSQAGADSYFRVYEWGDGVTLALQAMTNVMPPGTDEQWLRGYLDILTDHADAGIDRRLSDIRDRLAFPPPTGARLALLERP